MVRTRTGDSVITRLVAALLLGGALLSSGMAGLEWVRSRSLMQLELTQRAALTMQNVRSVVRSEVLRGEAADLDAALWSFTQAELVEAIRVTRASGVSGRSGAWPAAGSLGEARHWSVSPHAVVAGDELSLSEPTVVSMVVLVGEDQVVVEAVLDGPSAASGLWGRVLERLIWGVLLVALMMLAGVSLLNAWVGRPLRELLSLVSVDAQSGMLSRWAAARRGELGELGVAMAAMLERAESARAGLDARERETEARYQAAPVAMLTMTAEGQVTHANREAALMFGGAGGAAGSGDGASGLVGRSVDALIAAEDLPQLWAMVRRADVREGQRLELRLAAEAEDGAPRWAVVAASRMRDDDHALLGLRLSLVDVTDAVRLRGELQRQGRLMNLLIDHMSDAIVLVDADDRVVAANQQLASLLGRPTGSIIGGAYDARSFWSPLGPTDPQAFAQRLGAMPADGVAEARERFDTRAGSFVFRGVAVRGDAGERVGMLWVVQETTFEEQGQRMLMEQNHRLAAVRRVAMELAGVWTYDGVVGRAVELLREELDVDSVGLGLRRADGGKRSSQAITRGEAALPITESAELMEHVVQRLLPRAMSGPKTLHWTELTPQTDYGRAFGGFGLATAAACPLHGSDDVVGVLWVGQRGRETLSRPQLLMLETISPVIAARLEVADQVERMSAMGLVDPKTRLLKAEALRRVATETEKAGRPWALLRVRPVQRVDALEQWQGLAAEVMQVSRRESVAGWLEPGACVGVVMPGLGAADLDAARSRLDDELGRWSQAHGVTLEVGWAASDDESHPCPSGKRSFDRVAEAAADRAAPLATTRRAA
ncbi:MAG: PAS domain-containing protein [Planctomycetota bacterium]